MSTTFDGGRFRETLGHYPTGVVVVTGLDEDGQPAGMVIGSFTSVSLDPPLVAFLPTKDSGSFARLRSGRSFCINVLAADQEDVCRRFSSRLPDKFDGVAWQPAPSGAPVLENVVAWIDCTFHDVIEAGDHYIVLGAVTDLRVPRPALPLLFFQGGYGRFTPPSLLAPSDPGIIESVRVAERVRTDIEELADDLGADCGMLAALGDDAVFVATANRSQRPAVIRLGARIPLIPPLGSVFLTEADEDEVQAWVNRAPMIDDDGRELLRSHVRTVRERGFSVSLREGHPETGEFEDALRAYVSGEQLPEQVRRLKRDLAATMSTYEPPIEPNGSYQVHSLVVAVPEAPDAPRTALRLANLPQLSGSDLLACVRRLQQIADKARGVPAGIA